MKYCGMKYAKHCPYLDNGYCRFYDQIELDKRKRLEEYNGIKIQGACDQTKENK